MGISKAKKALLHVAKHQLGLSDDDYRSVLRREGGVESSRDLDGPGFDRVMAAFERLGFRTQSAHVDRADRDGMATPAQVAAIRRLWRSYKGDDDERGLRRWLEKHLHASHPRFLDAGKAGKAVAILKKMNDHPGAARNRGTAGSGAGAR